MKTGRHHLSTWQLVPAVLIALAIGLFGLFSTDKQFIYSNNLNHCGIYCTMAVNYENYLSSFAFDPYYFQKSLTSLLTYIIMDWSGVEKTPLIANRILEHISVILLMGAAVFWFLISRNQKLSISAYWLGFVGLFISQPFIKLVPYAQESPDTAAFTLGMAGLFAATSSKKVLLILIYALSLFVQPQFKIFLIPFLLLSYDQSGLISLPKALEKLRRLGLSLCDKARKSYAHGAPVILILYLTIFSIIAYIFPLVIRPMHGAQNSIPALFPVSILLAAAFFTFVLVKMDLWSIIEKTLEKTQDKEFWKNLLIIFCLEAASKAATLLFARGEIMSGTSTFIGSLYAFVSFYYQAVEQPVKFLVAPLVFYGPAFALIMLSARNIMRNISECAQPLTFTLGIIFFLFLFPDTESRHFIAFMPWLVFLAIQNRSFNTFFVSFFAALAIIFSRFYADYAPLAPDNDTFLMSWGPWYTRDVYWRGLGVAVFLLLLMWLGLIRNFRRKNGH